MRRGPHRRTTASLTSLVLLTAVGGAGAQQETVANYTVLGRGFAAIVAYPIDEVPPTGEDDPSEEPPPDQTCPEGQRGVDEATAARLLEVGDTAGVEPSAPNVEDDRPTPRGQPIKFDFGMADTSLRSDPGAHSIAAFAYVDLGGSLDPWSSGETDGYATGHVRFQERCATPFAGSAGSADSVHIISEAIAGPYTYAFIRSRRMTLGGGVFVDASIVQSQMDGRGDLTVARTIAIADGIDIGGVIRADSVVTVIDVVTDGSSAGTEVRAWTVATGVRVAGQPVALEPGGPPITAGTFQVTVATPTVRELENGTIEVDAGGLLIGGQADNPAGTQAKQSISLAAAQLTLASGEVALPAPQDQAVAPPTPTRTEQPSTLSPFPARSVRTDITPPSVTPSEPAPQVAGAPVALPELRRIGVYREGPGNVGLFSVLMATLLLGLGGMLTFARARSWRFRALLGAAGFRSIDRAYRAFLRG